MMKNIIFRTQDEVEGLQKKVNDDLKAIIRTKKLMGDSCFTKEANDKIQAVHELDSILAFHYTPDGLNDYFKNCLCEKINHLVKGYVNYYLENRKHFSWE